MHGELAAAAEREAGFYEQMILPLLKQRNPKAREHAGALASELVELGADLHRSLLRRELGVQALLSDQGRVRAGFDDAAGVEQAVRGARENPWCPAEVVGVVVERPYPEAVPAPEVPVARRVGQEYQDAVVAPGDGERGDQAVAGFGHGPTVAVGAASAKGLPRTDNIGTTRTARRCDLARERGTENSSRRPFVDRVWIRPSAGSG